MNDTTREHARALGRRVATARRAANLTQVELAAKLNWPSDTLINYENGRRALSLERLIAVANTLNIAPAALLIDDSALAQLLTRLIRDTELRAQVAFFVNALDTEATKD